MQGPPPTDTLLSLRLCKPLGIQHWQQSAQPVQTLKMLISLHVEWNTHKQAFHSQAITSAILLTDGRIPTIMRISSSRTTTRRSQRWPRTVCVTYGQPLYLLLLLGTVLLIVSAMGASISCFFSHLLTRHIQEKTNKNSLSIERILHHFCSVKNVGK